MRLFLVGHRRANRIVALEVILTLYISSVVLIAYDKSEIVDVSLRSLSHVPISK